MIEIIYYRRYARVTVKGHAGTAPKGEDLVCAGVSAIAYTLAANAENLVQTGKAKKPVIRMDEGDAEISVQAVAGAKMTVEVIFRAICSGFELMAKRYPESVSFTIHG